MLPLIAALHSISEPCGAMVGVQLPVHVAVPETPRPVVVAANELLGMYIGAPRLLLKSTMYSMGCVDAAAVAMASAHGSAGSMLHDDCMYEEAGLENESTNIIETNSAIMSIAHEYVMSISTADCCFKRVWHAGECRNPCNIRSISQHFINLINLTQ